MADLISASHLYKEEMKKRDQKRSAAISKQAIENIKWICNLCPKFLTCEGKLPKISKNSEEFDFAIKHNDIQLFRALLVENIRSSAAMFCKLRSWIYGCYTMNSLNAEIESEIVQLFV
jgi:hypothetical protein